MKANMQKRLTENFDKEGYKDNAGCHFFTFFAPVDFNAEQAVRDIFVATGIRLAGGLDVSDEVHGYMSVTGRSDGSPSLIDIVLYDESFTLHDVVTKRGLPGAPKEWKHVRHAICEKDRAEASKTFRDAMKLS